MRHDVPVPTTNFEEVLSDAAGCDFIKPPELPFTDFYPWSCRFANQLLDDPCQGFGIWHINDILRFSKGKGGFLLVASLAMAELSLVAAVLLWLTPAPSR